MIQIVRVKTKIKPDLKGKSILNDIKTLLGIKSISKVETARVFRLEGVNLKEATVLAEKLFCEKITQDYCLNKPILFDRDLKVVEISYKPGVMNPEVASIIKVAKDLKINLKAADTSHEYGFFTKLSKEEVEEVINKLNLFNKIVEHIVKEEPKTLLIEGKVGQILRIPIRDASKEELLSLSRDKLFLNLEEMKAIQNYFIKMKRDPTDLELETLAQTWSEHSGHKTFKANLIVDGKRKNSLISRIQKEALRHSKNIVSAFVDNSGVIDFYEDLAICGKGETHNSPSAIEPYGGAMTGSGGVFRDIMGTGKGAKTIVSTDVFCFAPPDMNGKKLLPGTLAPRYLLKRVVEGVRDYGNRIGIPTNNGSVHFHEDFRAKPTVFVGAYGIIPKDKAKKGEPKVGDLILSVGGRVGRDGIHGATFSSGEMTERTINVNAPAVQIGNAIEEKRMFDALLEARDLIRAIQDSGGGGLSSAIGEMGAEIGLTIHLEKERLKYPGLSPWEIWVSESQERMIVGLPKKNLKEFKKICQKYNVEISELGFFDGSKKLNVYYGKEKISDLDMDFLHHGLPKRTMKAVKPRVSSTNYKKPKLPATEKEWIKVLKKVLSHGNVCSKEPIIRQYDHSVQATNDLQPYGGENQDSPNDAVVIRPLLDKPYGMVVSHGINPVLNRVDPYWGSIWAATEAVANYVAVGGDYKNAALINNYVWPFPDEESLWTLDRSVDAVIDFMKIFKIPVISGKDSLSSTYRGKDGFILKIPPVLCISVFGKIPNASKTISADFKRKKSVICLIGKMDFSSLGGSTYFDTQQILGGEIPHVDLKILPKVLETLYKAIQRGKILSAHDISEGGLITTIFEMSLGGNMGVNIDLWGLKDKVSSANLLFNETAGCFIVEVEDEQTAKELFEDIDYAILGKTENSKNLNVSNKSKLFTVPIDTLKNVWQKPMKEIFP